MSVNGLREERRRRVAVERALDAWTVSLLEADVCELLVRVSELEWHICFQPEFFTEQDDNFDGFFRPDGNWSGISGVDRPVRVHHRYESRDEVERLALSIGDADFETV